MRRSRSRRCWPRRGGSPGRTAGWISRRRWTSSASSSGRSRTHEGTHPGRRAAGALRGAADLVPLRDAVTDAERFADIVSRMGGVLPSDRVLLRDPTRAGLLDALGGTGTRAAEAKAANERVEVIVYFSGHADDQGLM